MTNPYNGRPLPKMPTGHRPPITPGKGPVDPGNYVAPKGTVSGSQSPLTNAQQSAFDLMSATLASWGLTALLPDLRKLIVNGDTSPDTLALALSQTQAYKQRFAGNDIRQKNGLAALTPAQYLATEEQYQNVLRSYGLPSGFYDSHSDFNAMIGNDISPAELDTRAKIAHDQYMAAPPEFRATWENYFGSKGDAIAAILDPTTATSIIQDRANQVAIGATAAMHGFTVNQSRAQQLQQSGVTLAQAQRAYQQIQQSYATDQSIASRFGTTFGQADEENDLLLGQGDAAMKRQTLYDEEQGLFNGKSGLDSQAMGVSQSY